jgi:hypothetical protein
MVDFGLECANMHKMESNVIYIVVVKSWTAGWNGDDPSCSVDVYPFSTEDEANRFARTFDIRGGWTVVDVVPKQIITIGQFEEKC